MCNYLMREKKRKLCLGFGRLSFLMSFANLASREDTEISNRMLQYDWHLDSFYLLIPNYMLPNPSTAFFFIMKHAFSLLD